MAKTTKKSSRKFAASGQLKKTIHARRKHQQIKKKIEKKGAAKRDGRGKRGDVVEDEVTEDEVDEDNHAKGSKKCAHSPFFVHRIVLKTKKT
jgi:nucleolar complex protein 2